MKIGHTPKVLKSIKEDLLLSIGIYQAEYSLKKHHLIERTSQLDLPCGIALIKFAELQGSIQEFVDVTWS